MTEKQIDDLNAVGFEWNWTPDPILSAESDASWEANYAKLQDYMADHGNFDVPMDGPYSKLGTWTRVQRNQKYYRDTKRKTFINKERVDKLDEIGFNWKGERKI